MNQIKCIGLSDKEVESILRFNKNLKEHKVAGYIRDVAIDFYCDYLNAVHPECGLQDLL